MPSRDRKGLIFDLDGTLADTMSLHVKAWIQTAELWEVTITAQMIYERGGTPTIQVIEDLSRLYGWSIDPYAFRIKKNDIYADIKKRNGKINPILPVLEIVHRYKNILPQSVGTGSVRKNAEMAIDDLGLQDHFEVIVTADDVSRHKPHPETFLKCADGMKVKPEDCLVYEDGPMGIEAAMSAGMKVIHIETLESFSP